MNKTVIKRGLVAALVAGAGMFANAAGSEGVVATDAAKFWLGPGCKSCPWTVGDDVTAYITGEELDIEGTGGMYDFASADNVPWAAFVDDVTAVTIAQDVTHVGKNSLAGFDDKVTANGTPLSFYDMMAGARGSAEPAEPSGAVSGAEPETVRIVDGKVLLGVSVCTNSEVKVIGEGEDCGWQKAAIEKAEVVDGTAILTVPATAEQGFMLLKSKGADPSNRSGRPDTADIQHD